jgi:hypothetical protein
MTGVKIPEAQICSCSLIGPLDYSFLFRAEFQRDHVLMPYGSSFKSPGVNPF